MTKEKPKPKPSKPKEEGENIQVLKEAIISNLGENGWASLSQVGSYLRNECKTTPADYKRASWSKVFGMYPNDFALKNENNLSYVSLKKYSNTTSKNQEKPLEKNPLVEKYKKICNFFGFSH